MALTKDEIRKLYGESSPVKMTFFNKIKMLFLHPAQFFEGVKNENLTPAFVMFLVFLIISNISGLVTEFLALGTLSLLSLPLNMVGGIVLAFVIYSWIHLFVLLFGGKKGIHQTFRAFMYASVPPTIIFSITGLLLAVIVPGTASSAGPAVLLNPAALLSLGIFLMIIIIVAIWAIYLVSLGIGRLHEISTARGFAALIVGAIMLIILFFILAIFVFAALFAALLGGGALPPPQPLA